MQALPTPAPLYVVALGQTEPYFCDRKLCDAGWDETVRDVATMQFDNLHSVVEVGSGLEVTDRVVREAIHYRASFGIDGGAHQFATLVELTLGTRAARPFFQRAA